jgi:transposase
VAAVSRPQVIDDEEHERVHDRVAAIDVAKDSGMVCTRTPHPSRPGARRSTVWTVKARMNAVRTLGRQLARDGIEIVTLESTSDHWRIWFFVLEAGGLAVQLVHAAQAKNLPGRPKTDKLDAMWLARLTEMGLLRASFVPPRAIRDLRDYTRMRTRLTQERTRCWQRLEKLLEAALVKVSSVVSKLTTISAQDMIRAMIAGQRDPHQLAGLARGSMKAKHDDLVEALDGIFDDHHGELAGLLLDQITVLDAKIAQLGTRAAELAAAMPPAWGVDADGTTGPGAGTGPGAPVLNAVARLAEIPGLSPGLARSIIAETGLDMGRFPTAGHLVSWAGLCPSARQSGPRSRAGKKGQGDTWLRGSLGQAAVGAARTATFLGERYARIARRRGKAKAQVAVARSILVIIWHLLADPAARYTDLGYGYYQARTDTDRKLRNHIRQIQALGFAVTLTRAA